MTFPSYAIAIIIILVIIAASTSVYFIFRKRIGKKRGAVGAAEYEEEQQQNESEKSKSFPYAVRPLMQYNNNNNNNIDTTSTLKGSQTSSTSTIPSTASPSYEKTTIVYENKNLPAPPINTTTTMIEDNDSWATTPAADNTDFEISLPLPPPSSSFFSDKMELDSIEANDLYASYMKVAAQQQDYVSIDLDEKPFLFNAAANIQQKAATLRSALRQSLRRKSTSGVPKVALNQFFDNINTSNTRVNTNKSPRPDSTRMSRQSSSTSSRFPRSSLQQQPNLLPPSPRPDSPASTSEFFGKFSNNSSKKSLLSPSSKSVEDDEEPNSNKIMINNISPESFFSLPMSPSTPSPLKMKTTIQQQQEMVLQQQQELIQQRQQQQQEYYSSMINEINNNDIQTELNASDEEEPLEEENDENKQQDAALAARRLIRSASRKSRTRSTIITDEAAQAMLALIASNTPSPSEPPVSKYATLRKHNMEIDTSVGSVRRPSSNGGSNDSALDIRKWSNDSPLSPSPKRAIMSSTLFGSATVSGKRMAKQQLKSAFNNSSDNLLNNERGDSKSVTLGKKSGVVAEKKDVGGPKSLRNLFTRPSIDNVSVASPPSIISTKEEDICSNKSLVVSEPEDKEEQDDDDDNGTVTDIINTTPSSPVTAPEPQASSPYSSKNNTLRKMGNNVDTIRRMLQSSWSGNNLKESGSSNSLSSSSDYMGSVGSSYRPIVSPLGSVNPRLQNQHLVSLSLKASNVAQQSRSRPSMPVGFMNDGEEGLGGPTPTASFSSSTVRTMIPADEEEVDRSKKKSVMRNLLGSRPQRQSKLGDRKTAPMNNNKKQQQQQGGSQKTPAQIEWEKYLQSLET